MPVKDRPSMSIAAASGAGFERKPGDGGAQELQFSGIRNVNRVSSGVD